MSDLATDDRVLLNRLAEQARHWQDVEDLRAQQAELRARRTNQQHEG